MLVRRSTHLIVPLLFGISVVAVGNGTSRRFISCSLQLIVWPAILKLKPGGDVSVRYFVERMRANGVSYATTLDEEEA